MKKKKKAYFSKTFVYLVLLIAVVAGFFIMVNYVTNQKLSMNSEASTNKCQAFRLAEYSSCTQVKTKSKDIRNFIPCDPGKKKDTKYIYCRAVDIVKGNDCRQAGGTDWFKMEAKDLAATYNKKYIVVVTDVSGNVGQYYKDQNNYPTKKCLYVGKMTKRPSCSDEKGDWYRAENCYRLNNSKYIYVPVHTPSANLSDYKNGQVCCEKVTGDEY